MKQSHNNIILHQYKIDINQYLSIDLDCIYRFDAMKYLYHSHEFMIQLFLFEFLKFYFYFFNSVGINICVCLLNTYTLYSIH